MSKKDNESFKNSTKCWICDHDYIDKELKAKDHCHITVKYTSFEHRDCDINLTLNQKFPVKISHRKKL